MHWHGLFWPELELAIGTAKIFLKFPFVLLLCGLFLVGAAAGPHPSGLRAYGEPDPGSGTVLAVFIICFDGRSRSRWLKC
jgi:hypothetical protein